MKIFEEKGYKYDKHIKTGGEGEVHLIRSVDKKYIAKIFQKADENSVKMLNDLSKLNIPNIPKIHEVFDYGDKTVVIRDYVEGTTLHEEIKKNGYFTFKRAKDVLFKVCETLSAFHKVKPNPIIYRDLKPENIIITPKGEVMLIDFGIIRYHKLGKTRDTVLAGTTGYTAPEVMAGMQSDKRSDVYSAGLLFYEMLTGRSLLDPPYQLRPVKEVNEYLPDWVDAIIAKAANISKVARFATIDEFVYAINHPEEAVKKPVSKLKLSGAIVAAAVVIGVVYVVISKFFMPSAPELILDINFENDDYEGYVLARNNTNGNAMPVADTVSEGIYTVEHNTVMGFELSPGDMMHLRFRPEDSDEYGAFHILKLLPDLGLQGENSYDFCFTNLEHLSSEIRNSYGYFNEKAEGFPVAMRHTWFDLIIWHDDNEVIRYFIMEANDEIKIAYGGMKMRDEWSGAAYTLEFCPYYDQWNSSSSVPKLEMDFVKYTNGSVADYMNTYIPAYRKNKADIDEFMQREIEIIPQEEYVRHGY